MDERMSNKNVFPPEAKNRTKPHIMFNSNSVLLRPPLMRLRIETVEAS